MQESPAPALGRTFVLVYPRFPKAYARGYPPGPLRGPYGWCVGHRAKGLRRRASLLWIPTRPRVSTTVEADRVSSLKKTRMQAKSKSRYFPCPEGAQVSSPRREPDTETQLTPSDKRHPSYQNVFRGMSLIRGSARFSILRASATLRDN